MLEPNDDRYRAFVVYIECPVCNRVNQLFRSTYMLLKKHQEESDDRGVFVCVNKNGSETHDIKLSEVFQKRDAKIARRKYAFNKGTSREAESYIRFCLKHKRNQDGKRKKGFGKKENDPTKTKTNKR